MLNIIDEFTHECLAIRAVGASIAYIKCGSPWENGFIEGFNARLRDELLDGEIFYTLPEAQIVIEELAPSLQSRPAACLNRLPCSRPRGVRPGTRRMAGSATPTNPAPPATLPLA
jgi:putative transposase